MAALVILYIWNFLPVLVPNEFCQELFAYPQAIIYPQPFFFNFLFAQACTAGPAVTQHPLRIVKVQFIWKKLTQLHLLYDKAYQRPQTTLFHTNTPYPRLLYNY